MAKFANSVLFTPTLGGLTDWTVNAAVQGYMTPTQAGAPDGVYKYRAESSDLSQWEVGEGTYTGSGPTLTRTTVLQNSSGTTSKINFSTVPNVGVVALKQDLLSIEDANLWTYIQQAQGRANLGVLKKNYIVNGGMQVSQEWGTTAPGVTNGSYPADQFVVSHISSGAVTVQQVASVTPGGSTHRVRFTVNTADATVNATDYLVIAQPIEGNRIADLKLGTASAKTITIQFGVKAPAGTYCVAVRNAALTRAYVGEYVISGGEANTDVVKSVSLALDTTGTWAVDNTIGTYISFALMVGSNFQQAAGSWGATGNFGTSNQFNFMGTNGNVFELFDVGLYEGNAAPPFQLPDFASELIACQRYYYQWFGTASGFANGATVAQLGIMFPVVMRATPSFTATSTLATVDTDTASNINPSSVNYTQLSTNSRGGVFRINNYSSLNTGRGLNIQASSSALVNFSARM